MFWGRPEGRPLYVNSDVVALLLGTAGMQPARLVSRPASVLRLSPSRLWPSGSFGDFLRIAALLACGLPGTGGFRLSPFPLTPLYSHRQAKASIFSYRNKLFFRASGSGRKKRPTPEGKGLFRLSVRRLDHLPHPDHAPHHDLFALLDWQALRGVGGVVRNEL